MTSGGTPDKLNICMLLPVPRYGQNMRVCPQTGISSYLTSFGHQVSWIIWADHSRQIQPFFLDDVHVHVTTQASYFPTSLLLGRILNRISNAVRRMRQIYGAFRHANYDLIFVRNNVVDGLAAAYIKRRHKVPFVFELSSPLEQAWEIHRIEAGKRKTLSFLSDRLTRFLANRLLREADLVLPTSRWLKDHLVAQGVPESKIMPYPNGVDTLVFCARDETPVRQNYHLTDARVITYVGTLGKGRQLSLLIRAFWLVEKKRENVKLLVVGEGSDGANLRRLACEMGIASHVIFTGQVPQSSMPDLIAASDIGLSPVPPFSFYKLSSPIKMFEYMAMAKPVVANEEIPEHKEVLEHSGGGILVPFTPESFAGAIIELLDSPDKATDMGRRGRDWVLNNRTYDILARKVEEAYYRLLEKQQR